MVTAVVDVVVFTIVIIKRTVCNYLRRYMTFYSYYCSVPLHLTKLELFLCV